MSDNIISINFFHKMQLACNFCKIKTSHVRTTQKGISVFSKKLSSLNVKLISKQKTMKKSSLKNVTTKLSVCAILMVLASCQSNSDSKVIANNNKTKDTILLEEETVKRGEYLVTTLGCEIAIHPKR